MRWIILVSAAGVGRILLLLIIDFSGIEINEVVRDKAVIDPKPILVMAVSQIIPICGNVDGKIIMQTAIMSNLDFTNLFCSWMRMAMLSLICS